ncbi:MAG TPA: hypothetical protein PK961_07340 [bacterium]|nr:hypothetical protein [bacterium]
MKLRLWCLLIFSLCLLGAALTIACGDDDDDDDDDNDVADGDDDAPSTGCVLMGEVWAEGCVNAYAGYAGPGELADIMQRCCSELEETVLVGCLLACLENGDDCATQKPCVDDCVAQAQADAEAMQDDHGQALLIDCIEHGDGEDHSGCDYSCEEAMNALYDCDRAVNDGQVLTREEAIESCAYGSESPANDGTTASCIRIKCFCQDDADCPALISCAISGC